MLNYHQTFSKQDICRDNMTLTSCHTEFWVRVFLYPQSQHIKLTSCILYMGLSLTGLSPDLYITSPFKSVIVTTKASLVPDL